MLESTCQILDLLVEPVTEVNLLVGVYTITALSVERYIDVTETNRRYNDQMKLIIVLLYIIVLWICAICFPLPMSSSIYVNNRTSSTRSSGYEQNRTRLTMTTTIVSECKSMWTNADQSKFVTIKFISAFLLPSFITCTFSFRLILFLHRWSKQNTYRRTSYANTFHTVNVYKRRATTLVLIIIIIFFLLWSPFWILQLYDSSNKHPTRYIQILNFLTLVLVYANGFLNPLLYLILTQNFREYMKNIKWIRIFRAKQTRQKYAFIYVENGLQHTQSVSVLKQNTPSKQEFVDQSSL
ncbi:unnamed protein product [Didymodactylos carnosus]|uniref:G-protein coupled receptors family 1 profile domain-containing protein n=1 Tax=Didymodactylos carnosus TaxID=1234261 RepID=A0A814KEV0_9BILA|nr:unnamed protein product [Didymodactylos carnosus]CAF1050185.1 unnamed protein product [Didymodactylos carnosus]CAF3609675.1 unnamed protein product [Didymodactylos carnosus]CAF3819807.1 unnamed protein product [Didymodactylos carnosus]